MSARCLSVRHIASLPLYLWFLQTVGIPLSTFLIRIVLLIFIILVSDVLLFDPGFLPHISAYQNCLVFNKQTFKRSYRF